SSVRCAYLTNGATLAGFTLTNGVFPSVGSAGAPIRGGGVFCQSVAAVLTNCIITGNSAMFGGGVYQGTLNNCVLSGNTGYYGGGTCQATLNNCAIIGNTAVFGGGASLGTLNNCTLTGNSSSSSGGGSSSNTLNNCIVYYNNAPAGSNYSASVLNSCCTIPLPADGANNFTNDPQLAGAFHIGVASPCRGAGNISYVNGTDIDGEPWANPPSVGCDEYWPGNATGPVTVGITANFTNVAAGFTVNLTAAIAGRVSSSTWDFGDGVSATNHPYASHSWTTGGNYAVTLTAFNDDFPGGVQTTLAMQITGPNILYVAQSSTNPVAPYTNWATAASDIQSALDQVVPGQSVLVSNGVYQTGGRLLAAATVTTNRVVVTQATRLSSVNGPAVTTIQGQRASGGGDGPNAIRCVYLAGGAILDGFTLSSGATASYENGGGVYCASTNAVVTNCILYVNYAYLGAGAYSGTLNNCTFQGDSAYDNGGAANQSILNHCLVTGNACNYNGGGVAFCTLNNCVVSGNRGNYGGGAYSSVLNNCLMRKNLAQYTGAAAYYGTLNNCSVADNYAFGSVGGTYSTTANNCVIYYNGAASGAQNSSGGTYNYCCITPVPGSGVGNITNDPALVNVSVGDFHLQSNSPCINAGCNFYATNATDLDGNPRIVGGTVDIGAYEYQTPGSVLSYAWAQQYGLPTDGTADYADTDGVGMNNWQKWIAGLNPTNPASVLVMSSPVPATNAAGVTVTWQSVNTRKYYLQRAADFTAQPVFTTIQSNLIGQVGTTSYTDTMATNGGPYFYRVGVQLLP
ncbi:MAG TPA: choice-of-anchor Q domain-containing protein, partial [Verrucomicrobiae bacterium]|nr:choice-of-anchor Q domain-containing protein [Verrucomicrobiae bacterium]